MLKGVDISSFQTVDFSKLKVAVDFVIMKATEGYGFVDPKFNANQSGARNSGMLVGYYIYTRPDLGNTVEAEVDFLLKTIGTLKDGEIIFLDYEVSYAKPVAWCKAWLDYLAKKLNGYKGLVYLNQSLLNSNDWSGLISAGYGLWLAKYDYVIPTEMPATKWGVCAFQQYSNREVVVGIVSPVDANAFFGDKVQYKKYGYASVSTPTVPPVTPQSCEEQLVSSEKKLEDKENELIEMRSSRDKWKNKVDELEAEAIKDAQSSTEHIKNLQSTVAEQSNQIVAMNKTITDASLENKRLTDDSTALRKQLVDMTASKNSETVRADKVSKELADLKAKLDQGLSSYTKWQRLWSLFK